MNELGDLHQAFAAISAVIKLPRARASELVGKQSASGLLLPASQIQGSLSFECRITMDVGALDTVQLCAAGNLLHLQFRRQPSFRSAARCFCHDVPLPVGGASGGLKIASRNDQDNRASVFFLRDASLRQYNTICLRKKGQNQPALRPEPRICFPP